MDRLDEVAAALRSRVSVAGRPEPRHTVSERMAELHVPAVSVAVLESDGGVLTRAWGAEPTTLFQAASISKPVFAMAVMRLAAEGVLDLDRPVNELLRTWQLPDGEGVTARRILSHSAGLSVHGFPGYVPGTPVPTLVQILDGETPANTEAVRVVRPPGEAFQYSGGGYTLLQLLVEDVTGEPFAQLMRRVVLDPLGMRLSTYEQPLPAQKQAEATVGHDIKGDVIEGEWAIHPEQAAAGLWTNPSELVAVLSEMIHPGRVLDQEHRDAMLTPQADDTFGMGWALEGDWFQHGGSNAGFRAQVFASVTHERAAAVMSNADGGGSVCFEILSSIAEFFKWPQYLRERSAIDLDASQLDAIAGVYPFTDDFVLTIRRDDSRLVSSAPGLPERELFAASKSELFRTDFDIAISWTPDALEIVAGDETLTAPRKAS